MSGDSFHERMIHLVSDADFLYSFFLGLLPSLMDIGTDFSFAERWQLWSSIWFVVSTTTRLAEEGELTASGVAYAVIIAPIFEFVISLLGTILENNKESQFLVYFFYIFGEYDVIFQFECLYFHAYIYVMLFHI